ncbi:MAG: hypothetical protein ACO1RX_12835 [Candidatus Sericytochromatia bacterium]
MAVRPAMLALDELRFLEAPRFQAAWLTALTALTEEAARLPARQRGRLYADLDALWQLLRLRLRLENPQPGDAQLQAWLPPVLLLTLFARYLHVWRRSDDWLMWLSTLYSIEELIHGLAFWAPRVAGISLKTRQNLLALAVQLLADLPEKPVLPWLEALAELVVAARQCEALTQETLLLDELRLLLELGNPSESLSTSRALMLLGLQLREPELAQAALQHWRRSWLQRSDAERRQELPGALADLELLGWRQLELKLVETSILQRWLGQMGHFLLAELQRDGADICDTEALLARLLRLGRQWGLPEAEHWQQALWAEPLPTVLALCLPDVWLYSERPEQLLRRLPDQLPDWVCRWGPVRLLPLLQHRWRFCRARTPEGQIWDVLMQIATVLLATEPQTQRQRGRRQRLLNWGMALWQASVQPAGPLDEAEACHQAELQRGWLQAVLRLPPGELSPEVLQQLQAEIPAELSDWLDWQAQWVLSAQGAAHLSEAAQRQGWSALQASLQHLDVLERLQGLAALGQVWADMPAPAAGADLAALVRVAEGFDPDWQGAALAAVGHCQVRAGNLAAGLAQLAQIASPTEQLSALLQVGTVLSEIGDGHCYPELLEALLACAQRQHNVLACWQAHITVALAQFTERTPLLGVQSLRAGLAHLPEKALSI